MPDSLFATVALDQPLDSAYTYLVPAEFVRDIRVGSRVTVPLGRSNRLTPATVLALSNEPPPPIENQKLKIEIPPEESLFEPPPPVATTSGLKPIASLLCDVLPVPQDLLNLAQWIAAYYCAPIGMTLATMVPAAVKRNARLPANLLIHLVDKVRPAAEQVENLKVSPKTKKIFEQLHFFLNDGAKAEHEVLQHAEIARPMLKRLLALNLLRMPREL